MSIPVQKFTTNPVRHELEPLTKRFPLLGQPISASWVAGDVGDPEIPGPSAYWIDSVVEVSPDVVDTLKSTYQPEQTSAQPDVWNSLLPMLPVGGYLAGSALDQAFSSRRIWTKVFLAEQENVVVIAAVGE